ncbi:MAG: MFS transporter [Thermodesulfobacteriota bacterium]
METKTKTTKVFYGWYIVGIAFWANFMSVGTGFYALNAFMEPLCNLRGWTRTDINLALVIGTFFGFLGQFVYGTLVRRGGVRRLMLLGALSSGVSFVFIPRAETLWGFYLVYTLLFIGNGAYGGIVAATAVNNWFIQKRGQALGLSTSGISLSGAVLPMTALYAITRAGIEEAALILGASVLLVAPLAWSLVRDWPEDLGLQPDGLPGHAPAELQRHTAVPTNHRPSESLAGSYTPWTLARLLRNGSFWKMGCSFGLLMIGTVGVMSQLKPRFSDLGFNDLHAMGLMSVTALVGAMGKYFWGSFCDRFEPTRVAVILSLANAAGLGLALFHDSFVALTLFMVVFGFTMGGIMSIYPVMVAHLFGRESFPSVLRYISIFLISQLLGYIIAGQSFDRAGSYDPAYGIFMILDCIAAILLLSMKPTTPQDYRSQVSP